MSRAYSLTVKYAYPDGINMGKGQESRKGPMRLGTKEALGEGKEEDTRTKWKGGILG